MKILLTFFLLSIQIVLFSCKKEKYYLNLDSKSNTDIYLIKSNDSQFGHSFYPDSLGIVYIPQKIYDGGVKLYIKVDNEIVKEEEFVLSDGVFFGDSVKFAYKTFKFPFSSAIENQKKAYWYNGGWVSALEYFFQSQKIDRNRVSF